MKKIKVKFFLVFLLVQPSAFASSFKSAPCQFDAFVADSDLKGLNVRAEPSVEAKIVGTIPPALKSKKEGLVVYPTVQVTAVSGGWFKIKNAQDNESLLGAFLSLKPRKMFRGEGWVSGKKLTVKSMALQAYSGPSSTSAPALGMVQPSYDSDEDLESFRLIDCQADWVLVKDKRRKTPKGIWLNKICGIQETSCDGSGN